jgi:hypothetical protein
MDLQWKIGRRDVRRIQAFVASQADRPFVKRRIARNVEHQGVVLTRARIWYRLVGSLLTSQQRSGPGSSVFRFITTRPFPLRYALCREQKNVRTLIRRVLRGAGGLRFWPRSAAQLVENYQLLEEELWPQLRRRMRLLLEGEGRGDERECAHFVADHIAGFGPKQSRNILQVLGVTRYEIPLDSRIAKWLMDFGFPIKLTPGALADTAYYEFVLDGIQELCRRSEVLPCVLDAAIFTSFDKQEWPESALLY